MNIFYLYYKPAIALLHANLSPDSFRT